MPVQYPAGINQRTSAYARRSGAFRGGVSHMGQVLLDARMSAHALEQLTLRGHHRPQRRADATYALLPE